MENKSVGLILIQCQGLGLQINESLDKLSSLVEDKELQAETAYLLDDQGEIVCTLLKDKEIYESTNNQDRRVQNTKNGFNVVWVHDGKICIVFYHQKKEGRRYFFILSIVSAIIGCFIGWIITCSTLNLSSDTIANIEELQNNNQLLQEQNDSIKVFAIELQRQKDSVENRLAFVTKTKDSLEKEISSSRDIFNNDDVAFIKSLFLKVNRHSFYSYLAITNTLIGEAGGSLSTKEKWLTNPRKYYFKIIKSKDGVISGQYSFDGGESYSDLSIKGNPRDINDVSRYTYLLFNKMGVLKEFEAKGRDAVEYINERRFLADHRE